MSDTLQIISMVAGALAFLSVQAGGLIVYWNRAITAIKDGFKQELAAQKVAHDAAIEQLHGRINNIRKEFVTGAQFERDIARLENGSSQILVAIKALGDTMRDKISDLERENAVQEFRLGAIDDRINGRGSAGA